MDTILRAFARWKARRKSAQIIIFDGGAEVETSRAFLKGGVTGVVVATLVFLLAAPSSVESHILEEVERREALVREANERVQEAMTLTDLCLRTAHGMEQTLHSYQERLGRR
jgi:gas vesicle protein